MEAQAVATQLMVELCGARLAPGTIDIGGAGPPPDDDPAARRAGRAGLLGAPIPRERSAEILTALDFERRRRADGLDVTRAGLPPRRRHPRGRPDRGGGAARRRSRSCPRRCPPATARPAALTPRQRLRRRAADALDRPGPARDRRLELRRARAAPTACGSPRPPRVVALENPMSAEQAELRTTLLGSLLDVARRNRARGAGDLRLFESGAVYLPRGRASRCRDEPTTLGGAADRAPCGRRPGASRPRPPPTSSPPRACSRRCSTALRVPLDGALAGPAAVPAPGPRGRASTIGGAPVGWLGEMHPLVAARVGARRSVAGFELDLDLAASPRAGEVTLYRDLTSFPEVREDLAVVVVRGDRPPPRCWPSCAAARRRAAGRRRGLRRLSRPAGSARATSRWPCALSLPRAGPDAHRRRGGRAARGDRGGAGRRARGADPCLSVAVFGAAGYPGRSRPPAWRHPAVRAARGDRALGRRAAGWMTSTRTTGCRWSSRSSTSTATPRSTRRSSPTRTAPPPARRRRCAQRGVRGGRPERRLPPARSRGV